MPVRRRHRAQPGRPALHLLPVLSDAPTTAPRQPTAAPPPGPHGFRARDASWSSCSSAVLCSCCSRAPSVRTAGDEMQPGLRARRRAGGRQAGRLGRRPAAVRRVARRRDSPACRPTRTLGDAGGFDSTADATAAGGVPPVTPDAFDPAELGATPRRSGRSTRCSSPATRSSMPLDTEIARRLADATASRCSATRTSAPASPRAALRRLGQALDAAGRATTSPTRWSCSSAPTRASRCPGPAAGRRLLRRRLGGRLREPRAADDEHLPPGRRRARLLADAADPARRRPRSESRARSTPRSTWPRSRTARQVRVLDMAALFTPGGRLPRRDDVDGRRRIVRDAGRDPPQRRRAPRSPPTRCWRQSGATSAAR